MKPPKSKSEGQLHTSNPLKEWLDSAVSPEIFELNVLQVSDGDYSTAYELLCYSPNLKRTNAGILARSWLKRYDHCKYGGWWCSGIDPLTWDDMQWGCFKPLRPLIDQENKNKITKYEHPPKTETRLWLLRVSDRIWEQVSQCYEIAIAPEDREHPGGFWHWVWQKNVPIVIVEGAKKAGCLLTLGYAAIAVPGIWNGRRAPKDDNGKILRESLIPDLQLFATLNRDIYFCFDNDSKRKTRKNVQKAIEATGTLFAKAGCNVKVIQLPRGKAKGVDDFIVAGGEFSSLYDTALALDNYKALNLWELTYSTVNLNQRWVCDIKIPDTGLVCIKSPPGTGKTELFVKEVEKLMRDGTKTLCATHRIQLGRAIVSRLALDWIEDKRIADHFGTFGYGLCIDSLHPNSQARFNPENWEGATFIIDEAEQVINHLLNSSTCYKNRVAILKTLRQLLGVIVQSGGRIVLADADLSDVAVDYIRNLIRQQAGVDWEPYTIVNEWSDPATSYDCVMFNDSNPSRLEHELDKFIKAGNRVLIQTDSKNKGKVLERSFTRQFKGLRVLRIDAETVANPTHPAYGCVERLNEVLKDYDIAICSPTIGTGVSIDLKGHFDAVFGIFNGVISVAEARQALIRLREPVKRFVWAKSFGLSKIANGSVSDFQLRKTKGKEAKIILDLLECDLDILGGTETRSLQTWALMGARFNAERLRYFDFLQQKLEDDGHRISLFDPNNTDPDPVKAKRQELRQIKDEIELEDAAAIVAASDLTHSQYQQLKDKRQKTQDERFASRKYDLEQKYQVPVTPDLVLKDNRGWYPKILLHYFMLNPTGANHRDRAHLQGHLDRGEGQFCLQDLRWVTAKTEAMHRLKVMQWFDPDRELCHHDADLRDWAEWVKGYRREIADYLELCISESDSPIKVLALLLGKLGIKLERLGQRRVNGERLRFYCFPEIDDGREQIFNAWNSRGMEEEAA